MARSKSEQEAKREQVKKNMAVGTEGEKIVKANLQGRQIWKSNVLVDSIIDPKKLSAKHRSGKADKMNAKTTLTIL